jgi:hypothetical protein
VSISEPARPVEKAEICLRLIESLSTEISAYRQRVLTTFRDAAIVQALLTWGATIVSKELPKSDRSSIAAGVIYLLAAVGCIGTGWVGMRLMKSYRTRIRFVRDRRNIVAGMTLTGHAHLHPLFFPTVDGGPNDYPAEASAKVYVRFLYLASGLTGLANIVIAVCYWLRDL